MLIAGLAAALCVATEPAAAPVSPPGRYLFRSYGTEQGLRNLAVYTLEQDAQGFIWTGSEDGLYRYDGQRFERFGADEGLPTADINTLHRAGDGRLWVGTEHGLAALEGTRFRSLGPADGVPEGAVRALASQRDGTLYVVTGGKLYVGSTSTRFTPVEGLPSEPEQPRDSSAPEQPRALPWDPGEPDGWRMNGVWVEPEGRELLVLAVTDRSTTILRRDASGAWSQERLPGEERCASLLRDARGRLWVRSSRMLFVQERAGAPFRDVSARLPGRAGLHPTLILDAKGRVWVPTRMGLAIFEGEHLELLGEEQGLPTHWAEALLVDREGSLWVASEGLHRAQGRLAWSVHSRRSGLPADSVWRVFRDSRGRLWAATSRGLAEGTATGWSMVPESEGGPVYAVTEDGEGGVWAAGDLGTRSVGKLLHLPPGATSWSTHPLSVKRATPAVGVLAWDAKRQGLWVGTILRGLHFFRLAPEGPHVAPVLLPGGSDEERIQSLHVDRHGDVWVGGQKGLAHLGGDRWQRFGVEAGLVESSVDTITETPSGELLLSYENADGLTRFLPAERRAVPYEGPPELFNDNIYSAGYDARGALWLGTATGIKRWDGRKLERYGQGSGLPGEDCSANALLQEPGGDVWVGMSSGLAHFDVSVEQPPPAPPTTVITAVAHGNRPPARPTGEALELPYEERAVEFQVAALGFLNEAQVALQTRLEGFENDWRESGLRVARYSALPAGRYRFEARARLADGEWGPVAAQAFRIAAPWWQTWWGLALLGLCAGALLAQLFRWRLRYLSRENERLESLVRKRTRELEESTLLDPLTGAKNRRFLQLTLPDEVARLLRRWRAALAGSPPSHADIIFLMVDLDHFKSVNDTYGHSVGDRVLRQASTVLRGALRETDTLVRWGGEEFLVVAQATERSAAESIAVKLRDAIRGYEFDLGEGQRLRRTCSIGFASFPFLPGAPDALSWEDVVELSDRCLYAAKNSGRDGWVGLTCRRPLPVPEGRLHVTDVLPGLLDARVVELVSSFPPARRLVWR